MIVNNIMTKGGKMDQSELFVLVTWLVDVYHPNYRVVRNAGKTALIGGYVKNTLQYYKENTKIWIDSIFCITIQLTFCSEPSEFL